jgi:hypothetical protein
MTFDKKIGQLLSNVKESRAIGRRAAGSDYSCRNAVSGSTRAARRAGR